MFVRVAATATVTIEPFREGKRERKNRRIFAAAEPNFIKERKG